MSITYVPRVTQLDSLQLDSELEELFKQILFQATKYFQPGLLQPILPEVDLCIRTWLFKNSVYDKRSTFGQQMLSLKYKPNNFVTSKLYWYFVYSVGLKYIRDRVMYSFTSNINIQNFLSRMETFQLVGDILNFLRFIQSGKHPALIDFILGLELTADKLTREDLTDFSWTRELLWHNLIKMKGKTYKTFLYPNFVKILPRILTGSLKKMLIKANNSHYHWEIKQELIGTVLSLFNMFGLRQRMNKILKYMWWKDHKAHSKSLTQASMSLNSTCACCNEKPVLPHIMGCSHVFCYYCLSANKSADSDFTCPKCYYNGKEVTKYIMDN